MCIVLYRPFATVNLEATQMSCAQFMSQFVPSDLVGCQSVVLALVLVFIKSTCQSMMTEDCGLAVRPLAMQSY